MIEMPASPRVLITGADGFLGRNLRLRLAPDAVITFDIRDGDVATHDFHDCGASHVFHLAARTFVPESWEKPYDYYRTNMLGTVNLLEYCRRANASITFVSTYTYGAPEYLPIDEAHPCKPHSVYNHTKYLAEDICRFYAQHYDIPVTILRLFNLYGEGQRDDFLIPLIVRQALTCEAIELMDLSPRRDFVYVHDVTDAMVKTIGCKGFHLYNVGSGSSQSVLEVCQSVLRAVGVQKPVLEKGEVRKNEVTDIVADISKIQRELGWTPQTSFAEGIRRTVEAFRKESSQ